jgi:hypothetical protein
MHRFRFDADIHCGGHWLMRLGGEETAPNLATALHQAGEQFGDLWRSVEPLPLDNLPRYWRYEIYLPGSNTWVSVKVCEACDGEGCDACNGVGVTRTDLVARLFGDTAIK